MIKKFRWLMFIAMVMIGGHATVSSAAMYDGAWLPNDNDFFTVQTSATDNPDAGLYIYDFDQGTTDNLLLFTAGVSRFATVYITQDSSNIWYAGLSSGAKTLDLGNSRDFGFYFWDGGVVHTLYDVTTGDPGEVYSLFDTNTDMTVLVSDIAPVPLPASLLLLGSGIISLVVSRRKFW